MCVCVGGEGGKLRGRPQIRTELVQCVCVCVCVSYLGEEGVYT